MFSGFFGLFRHALRRNGKIVKYSKGAAKRAKDEDEGYDYNGFRVVTTRLEFNQPQLIRTLDLKNWYDQLDSGNYQLVVKHKFQDEGKWLDFPPITFEVIQ